MGNNIYRDQLSVPARRTDIKNSVVFLLTLLSLCVSSLNYAQSDNDNTLEPLNLEQEFNKEQEKLMLGAYEGDRDAQFKVAVFYTNDQFKAPDYEQAIYWYKQASRQGHTLAQYNLGHQYLTGQGIEKSETQAMYWWLKAARQGHALAQFNIARGYYLGIGIDKNLTKSHYWFSQAAANDEPKSISILKELDWHDTIIASDSPQQLLEEQDGNDKLEIEPNSSDVAETALDDNNAQSQQPEPVKETQVAVKKAPIPIYTTPAIRSVLITMIDDVDKLKVQKESNEWLVVTNTSGLPVWIHGDFIKADGLYGKITGDNVNARSVPIVTKGSKVGQFRKNESVQIIEQQKGWYRVVAPERFTAWVKKVDYQATKATTTNTQQSSSEPTKATKNITDAPVVKAASESVKIKSQANDKNDNDWLFSQNPNNFTLQLASFDNQNDIDEFLSKLKPANAGELYQFMSKKNGTDLSYFLYSSYDDEQQAKQAAAGFTIQKAWVRPFKNVIQNRCISWKKQLPPPPELNKYCIN